jgi:hypothetical protein
MAERGRRPTWIEVGVSHAGIRSTIKAINWAYCWAVTCEALGHEPSAEEVAEWWAMSRRTAFRDAFPMLESPAPIYADDVRATLAKHAAFGDRLDKWAEERKSRREQDALRAALGTATPPA